MPGATPRSRNAPLRCACLPTGWRLAAAANAVEDFIDYVSVTAPDFARPDGRYDTWHIRDTETGEFLHGFQHWRRVEGGLIRRLLEGPLHWLGLLQIEDGRVLLTEFGQAALIVASPRQRQRPGERRAQTCRAARRFAGRIRSGGQGPARGALPAISALAHRRLDRH